MLSITRLRLFLVCGGLIAATALAYHVATRPHPAGQVVTWRVSSSARSESPATPDPSPIPEPPNPRRPGEPSPPPPSVWHDLNSNTRATAYGEYAILRELAGAIEQQIRQFINSTSLRG